MTIEFVNGCLLDALDNREVHSIGHVVNCQGRFASGLAGAIRKRYPKVYEQYMLQYERAGRNRELFGTIKCCPVADDLLDLRVIYNLYGQFGYGTDKRHLNYGAIARCLEKMQSLTYGEVVGFPYLLGCGLAGGDWSIVLEMVEYYFKDHTVKIYKL